MTNQPPEEYDPNRPDIPAGPSYPSSPPPTYQPGYPPPPPGPAAQPMGQAGYPPPPAFAYPPPYTAGLPPFSAYPPPSSAYPPPPMAYAAPYPAQTGQGDGMAVAGFILGIISIPMAVSAFCGLIFGALGLVFSLRGRASIRNHNWAIAGIVLSCIGLALSLPLLFSNGAIFVYLLLSPFSH